MLADDNNYQQYQVSGRFFKTTLTVRKVDNIHKYRRKIAELLLSHPFYLPVFQRQQD